MRFSPAGGGLLKVFDQDAELFFVESSDARQQKV